MAERPMKTSRVEARLTPDALAIVRRAAELQGRSISDFVVAAAQDAANRAIEAAQIIRLSVSDQKAFSDAIISAPAPETALVRAAAAHRTLIKTAR